MNEEEKNSNLKKTIERKSIINEFNDFFMDTAHIEVKEDFIKITIGKKVMDISLPDVIGVSSTG